MMHQWARVVWQTQTGDISAKRNLVKQTLPHTLKSVYTTNQNRRASLQPAGGRISVQPTQLRVNRPDRQRTASTQQHAGFCDEAI